MKKRASVKRQLSIPICVAIAVGISIVLILGAAMLIGTMVINETIQESTIGAISKVLLFVASFVGITAATVMRDNNVFQVGSISCAIVIVIQMLICAFSQSGLSGAMLVNSLIVLAASGCAIGIKLGGLKKRGQRKRRYR